MGKHSISDEKKPKLRVNKKKLGFRLFIFVLIIFAIFGFLFAKRLYDLKGNFLAVLMGHDKHTLENLEPLNFLILGESTGMSDTIIVCSYHPQTQSASMLSIPRDTFTGSNTATASASHKINALFAGGKTPEKTLKAVNDITGLNIENYILIDTEALIKLVDVIGKLEFNVPIDMDYDDDTQNLHIHFKAGLQWLSGEEVEELVRFRHNNDGTTYSYDYGIEDYGRMHTQRDIISAIAKQTIQFKNVTEIGKIIDIISGYVKTNMEFDSFKDYIPYALKMNMDSLKTDQLPGESEKINGIWFFLYNKTETQKIVNQLFNNSHLISNEY